MSPRTGRPKIEKPKKTSLTLRLSEDEAKEIQECAENLNVSRTEAILKGIRLLMGK
ncbi:MAG: ribbon-helix-helix protein, CopG family [Clostridia bacterium]|nr:ribbon-helix-helix protein, CopG family [Clostridia bacterium]